MFARYMFHGAVPPWVSHLVRQVLAAAAEGGLAADAFGAQRYRDRPARPRHGRVWVAGFAAVWLACFVMILYAQADRRASPPMAACWSPPPSHPVALWLGIASERRPSCPAVSDSAPAPDR